MRGVSAEHTLQSAFRAFSPTEFLPASHRELTTQVDEDEPLETYRRQDGLVLSAISNRNFLKEILSGVMPLRGKRVFEIGTGTGYLAALLGLLCGPDGHVVGCEIIPELFSLSVANIERTGLKNVTLIGGDFTQALVANDAFDVLIATSSMSSIHPSVVGACKKSGGNILMPIEIPGGGDCFTTFKRTDDHLEVLQSKLSISVPTTGRYSDQSIWAHPVRHLFPDWDSERALVLPLQRRSRHFIHETLPFRSFLFYREPAYLAVNLGTGHLGYANDMAYGLMCEQTLSCFLEAETNALMRGPKRIELAGKWERLKQLWNYESNPTLADYRYQLYLSDKNGFQFKSGFRETVAER